jgi:hypothetical protein
MNMDEKRVTVTHPNRDHTVYMSIVLKNGEREREKHAKKSKPFYENFIK